MIFKKAVLIAGGSGTRLNPITSQVSKHLLPVYDKPMIYYPLSILMLLKIKNIQIVTTKESNIYYKNLLGNGKKLGINISYKIQKSPLGIAHAIKISNKFIANKDVCVILGDNIFYGQSLIDNIKNGVIHNNGATIFGYYMKNPNKYGVIKINKNRKIIKIVEKPKKIISNYAIPGIYFFDKNLIKHLSDIKYSIRKELEITDLLKKYHKEKKLNYQIFGRGLAWLDTGNADALLSASNFIKTIEDRQGIKVACLEEISLNNNWITKKEILASIKFYGNCQYSSYLKKIIS